MTSPQTLRLTPYFIAEEQYVLMPQLQPRSPSMHEGEKQTDKTPKPCVVELSIQQKEINIFLFLLPVSEAGLSDPLPHTLNKDFYCSAQESTSSHC